MAICRSHGAAEAELTSAGKCLEHRQARSCEHRREVVASAPHRPFCDLLNAWGRAIPCAPLVKRFPTLLGGTGTHRHQDTCGVLGLIMPLPATPQL